MADKKYTRRDMLHVLAGAGVGAVAGPMVSEGVKPPGAPAANAKENEENAKMGAVAGAMLVVAAKGVARREFEPDTSISPEMRRRQFQEQIDREREENEKRHRDGRE